MLASLFDRFKRRAGAFFDKSVDLVSESRQGFIDAVSEVSVALFVELALRLACGKVGAAKKLGLSGRTLSKAGNDNSQQGPEHG